MAKKNPAPPKDKDTGYFHLPAYVLSRFGFIGTHIVFAYWLNLLTNDLVGLGGATLDFPADQIKPEGECNNFIVDNVKNNLFWFGLWWVTHSVPARKVYKTTLGLWEHPIERPLFAAQAAIFWGLQVHNWKPISDCTRFDVFHIPTHIWAISGTVIAVGITFILALLYTLPDHVFGTQKYKYPKGEFPHGGLIRTFPYGVVRHPAAAGFLWIYWALPAYTPSHILFASLWTVFIVVGTYVFEEGGLKGEDEFGRQYLKYRSEVAAFFPTLTSLRKTFLSTPDKKRK